MNRALGSSSLFRWAQWTSHLENPGRPNSCSSIVLPVACCSSVRTMAVAVAPCEDNVARSCMLVNSSMLSRICSSCTLLIKVAIGVCPDGVPAKSRAVSF
eukprot:SAG31_NODE_12823_length_914_cov_1.015951_2_plen_100_part_00